MSPLISHHPERVYETCTLSPAALEAQNQIVYDYEGMGHNSTLPTRSSQGLSVKPQEYNRNIDFPSNSEPHNEYMNVNYRHSYMDFVDKPESVDLVSAEISRDLHNNNVDYSQREQILPFDQNGHHISNGSNEDSTKSPSLDYKAIDSDPFNDSRHGSETSDPYMNYEFVSNRWSSPSHHPESTQYQNGIHEWNINTVKEDPNMPDTAVIETTHPVFAKLKTSQGRLRMSISAGDLLGKTHEELVLLLIQLRRNKAYLERCRESLRKQIDQIRPFEQEYKRQLREGHTILDFHLEEKHGHFLELKKHCGEIENKLEMYKPIENLVDNMVTMGSLYGGNNYMLATQYRKHILHPDEYIPPKKMLEFSRQHQEDAIIKNIEKDVRELTNDEADLEEKMDRLCVLDRLIQEQSFQVTSLREDKQTLEKTLRELHYEQSRPSDRSLQQMERLANQQETVENKLSKSMLQLAEASKKLEQLNVESSKLEHDIALLRSKVHGELNHCQSVPSLMGDQSFTRHKMEKDLHRVKDVMDNLSKEGARLSQALNTLKLPSEMMDDSTVNKRQKSATYMETDLDSKESYDLASKTQTPQSPKTPSALDHPDEGQVGFVKYVRSSPTSHFQTENLNNRNKESPNGSQFLNSHFSPQVKSNSQEIKATVPVLSTMDGDVSYEDENMWDISDADDNTKRFYGLLPKERPRAQTVRDVKRQAEQRRERGTTEKFRGGRFGDENDRETEFGDVWRTHAPQTSGAEYMERTISPSELTPFFSSSSSRISVPKLKRSPRGRNRYLTISSSEPIKLEHALHRKSAINSSAGDLIPGTSFINNMPDIVRSSTIDKFDEETIDRELMKPEKVFIPERYIPDSDEEDLTEEEKEKRKAKADKIRKVLTEQSIHSWAKQIPAGHPEQIHDHVAKEKIVREHLLTVTQELAKEVTKKSKEAAGQFPSSMKSGKASRTTKGIVFSSTDQKTTESKTDQKTTESKSEQKTTESKTVKFSPTSPEVTTSSSVPTSNSSDTKLKPSNKSSSKINSKLTRSVFRLLLSDLVSESSSLMEFLAKNSCCSLLKENGESSKISPRHCGSKFLSKNFPALSVCQSRLKAASLRILRNPPFFETEVSYSKFKKHSLFGLTRPPDENEGIKESVWRYLESLLSNESEVQEETPNIVEIVPSLDALNLEPGVSVYKKPKSLVLSNSTPNLNLDNSNAMVPSIFEFPQSVISDPFRNSLYRTYSEDSLYKPPQIATIVHSSAPNLKTEHFKSIHHTIGESPQSASSELDAPTALEKYPDISTMVDPEGQGSFMIQKVTTPAVPLNCLFEENPEDLEDLEVFYRLAEEILKISPTHV